MPGPKDVTVVGAGMMGLSMAPATGRIVADIVAGRTPCVDTTPFNLMRFGWGR